MALVIGIPACSKHISLADEGLTQEGLVHNTTPIYVTAAVVDGMGAIPILLPPIGEAMLPILDRLDGLLLPGSPSNVAPSLYGAGEDLTPDAHDPLRDGTSLPLVCAALVRGLPVLAICRGHQELNVALGGSLHQRVHDVPGRRDHRPGPGSFAEKFAPRHDITLSGQLARLIGKTTIHVNSLHGQAIDRVADGLVVEALAEDGTIEAVRVAGARSFAFGVQWHPEWDFATNPESATLLRAFSEACRAYASGLRRAA